jgi:integrase
MAALLEGAVERGLIVKNPARGVAKAADRKRLPPFSYELVAKLGEAMRKREAKGENAHGLRIIRLLLLTGCRRNEIESLRRKTVDFSAGCFCFADTKSGPQNRIVGQPALSFIRSFLPLDGKPDDFLFPGNSKSGYFQSLPRVWWRVSELAGLGDMTIHDLRHWFASAAAGMGFTDLIIAKLLGHALQGVTARYANPNDAAVRPAADKIASVLAAHLDGQPMGEVVQFNATA